jgi:hypothetical protein
MLLSAVAAFALFAAPETTQSGEPAAPAAAAAKPATKRVCEVVEVAGSNLPKKRCRDVPVKAEPKPTEEAKADAPKAE